MAEVQVIWAIRPTNNPSKLLAHLKGHLPLLIERGLVLSNSIQTLSKTKDGIYIETFHWKDQTASDTAHLDEVVMDYWNRFEDFGEFVKISEIEDFSQFFVHLSPA